MRLELQKVSRKIDAKALADILRRDGAAIVENALDEDLLSALNAEFDEVIAATDPGLRNPTGDFAVEFYGKKTFASTVSRQNQRHF